MLSDLIKPRVCELGKIKIGGLGEERQKSSGAGTYRMPEKHDHFTVTTLLRDGKGDLIPDAELMASLKDVADADGKLRQLPIALLSNDPDDCIQAAYVWYNGKRLAAKGDGKTLVRYFDMKTGWLATPDVKPWRPEFADTVDAAGKRLFKLHVTLNCVVVAPAARWGGVYKFRSTSQISAENLYGSITQLRLLTGGQLRGLPLRLVVRPVQVSPEGKTTTVYVVHIELRGHDLQQIQQLAIDRARFEIDNAKQMGELQQQYRALLAAPGDGETAEEQAEVASEFHPEAEATGTPAGETPPAATGGQHAPAQPSPEQFEETFSTAIAGAADLAALKAVGADIKAAFEKGHIRQPHRDRLGVKYKAREAELKVTPTTEPAPTDSKSD